VWLIAACPKRGETPDQKKGRFSRLEREESTDPRTIKSVGIRKLTGEGTRKSEWGTSWRWEKKPPWFPAREGGASGGGRVGVAIQEERKMGIKKFSADGRKRPGKVLRAGRRGCFRGGLCEAAACASVGGQGDGGGRRMWLGLRNYEKRNDQQKGRPWEEEKSYNGRTCSAGLRNGEILDRGGGLISREK